jgi:hypothetical protein
MTAPPNYAGLARVYCIALWQQKNLVDCKTRAPTDYKYGAVCEIVQVSDILQPLYFKIADLSRITYYKKCASQ